MRSLRFTMDMAVCSQYISVIVGVFFSSSRFVLGDTVSKFSGINVHKRLVTEKAYHEKRYEDALKSAFIGTDEDFLAGYFMPFCLPDFLYLLTLLRPCTCWGLLR